MLSFPHHRIGTIQIHIAVSTITATHQVIISTDYEVEKLTQFQNINNSVVKNST